MKERPILFSAPMIRALLAGTKTQTRRAVKPQPVETHITLIGPPGVTLYRPNKDIPLDGVHESWLRSKRLRHWDSPYGKLSDRLYVRERFSYTYGYTKDDVGAPVWYWADGNPKYGDFTRPKPSIHMPRWASRILLEITGVSVERLQDISESDALAEGVNVHPDHHGKPCGSIYSPVQAYRDLWESINGPDAWAVNPWVWVVEFRRVVP